MKKLSLFLLISILAVFLMAGSVWAIPFGDSGTALQGVLDSHTQGGSSSVDVNADAIADLYDSYWETTASGITASTLIIELAAFAADNMFGVFDPADSTNKLELFSGSDIAGYSTSLTVHANGNLYIGGYSGQAPDAIFSSDTFGYYLDSSAHVEGGVFYSDTNLNSDFDDHMAAYEGKGDLFSIPPAGYKTWSVNEYVLAFEDLDSSRWANGSNPWSGSEPDYTDFVVMVESVQPIPEPATMFLFGLGIIGLVGLGRKKFFKK